MGLVALVGNHTVKISIHTSELDRLERYRSGLLHSGENQVKLDYP